MNLPESALVKNRTEEIGYDLWDEFAIPPFFDALKITEARKPSVIVGGRGCGKTSLLRYLCHESQFSPKRNEIQDKDLEHIGVYWKIDTHFAKILSRRSLEDDTWNSAFEHLAVLSMAEEILKSLDTLANSVYRKFNHEDLDKLDFCILESFNEGIPRGFKDLKVYIRKEINRFLTWSSNIRTIQQPVLLPKRFLLELVTEIKSQSRALSNTSYFVYIDEYENLLKDQQNLINTWLKHSETPLIFNLAMKPNSFENKKTVGREQLNETHDYRPHNLEKLYRAIDFELFAAEILFLRLWKEDKTYKVPIIPEEICSNDEKCIRKRKSEEYRSQVLGAVKRLFPTISREDVAKLVFEDDALLRQLKKILEHAITTKKIKGSNSSFLVNDFPEAGVVVPSLLHRQIDESIILEEIRKLRHGEKNKFQGSGGWIHNNIFGCLLLIYEPLGRICPLYSGFEAFILMARTNLRHFLELGFKTLVNENIKISDHSADVCLSTKSQSEAAKQASENFLREVKYSGNNGNQLYTFVLRIGSLFSLAQKRYSQSEPEQNHFVIKGDLDAETDSFLKELEKWSVIYINPITKQKGGRKNPEVGGFEYVLSPIYAPFFHISYRKIRSISLDITDLKMLISGNGEQFEVFLKKMQKEWGAAGFGENIDLFNQNNG